MRNDEELSRISSLVKSKKVLGNRVMDTFVLGTKEKPYKFLSGDEVAEWMTEVCPPNLIQGRIIHAQGIGLDESGTLTKLFPYRRSQVRDKRESFGEWHIDAGEDVKAGELIATVLVLNTEDERLGVTQMIRGDTFVTALKRALDVRDVDEDNLIKLIMYPRGFELNEDIEKNIQPRAILPIAHEPYTGLIYPNYIIQGSPDWMHRYHNSKNPRSEGGKLTRLLLRANKKKNKWGPMIRS